MNITVVKLLYPGIAWSLLTLAVPPANRVGESRHPELVRQLSNSPVSIDVVIVAHQDDWQLFMGDIIAPRILDERPVVFIYLTAGDFGRDSLYWLTRERGALESTRLSLGLTAKSSFAAACSTTKSLEHSIRKCTIGNTDSYFLRLPDGRRNGVGFAVHSFQSLRKLRTRRIASMTAVDSSTTYGNWTDLSSTVAELIRASSLDRTVTIHTSDPNVIVNPHDHFDHRMAGRLVADIRTKNRWNVEYYAGYALATRAANRSTDQARQKHALFLAYEQTMTKVNPSWSAYREHPAFYAQCMVRTYARSVISR